MKPRSLPQLTLPFSYRHARISEMLHPPFRQNTNYYNTSIFALYMCLFRPAFFPCIRISGPCFFSFSPNSFILSCCKIIYRLNAILRNLHQWSANLLVKLQINFETLPSFILIKSKAHPFSWLVNLKKNLCNITIMSWSFKAMENWKSFATILSSSLDQFQNSKSSILLSTFIFDFVINCFSRYDTF